MSSYVPDYKLVGSGGASIKILGRQMGSKSFFRGGQDPQKVLGFDHFRGKDPQKVIGFDHFVQENDTFFLISFKVGGQDILQAHGYDTKSEVVQACNYAYDRFSWNQKEDAVIYYHRVSQEPLDQA